jgi:hypothetical protein
MSSTDGIELEGRYLDVDGSDWQFKFRPIVDIDILEGEFELKGLRFEGRIDPCGGLPCR